MAWNTSAPLNNSQPETGRVHSRCTSGHFSPFLMWGTSVVLGTSYEVAGQLLNTSFFTASSLLFVGVVRAFGGTSRRLTILAALVAVLHPAFNEYRAFIIRDAGYLAFYLLALLYACPFAPGPGGALPRRCIGRHYWSPASFGLKAWCFCLSAPLTDPDCPGREQWFPLDPIGR